MSLQPRTIKTNFLFYKTDGFGRDSYINYNNGGFWKDTSKIPIHRQKFSLSPYCSPKNSQKVAPSFKYRSDGSGRDSYVLFNEGGLVRSYVPYNSIPLQHYLRNDQSLSSTCNYRKTYLTRNETKAQSLLHKIQKNVVDRLYTKEKRKFIPALKRNLMITSYNTYYKGGNNHSCGVSPETTRNNTLYKTHKSNSMTNLFKQSCGNNKSNINYTNITSKFENNNTNTNTNNKLSLINSPNWVSKKIRLRKVHLSFDPLLNFSGNNH